MRAVFLAVSSVVLVLLHTARLAADDRTVTLDGLKSQAPAQWKAEKSTSEMRAYQFRLPKADGDSDDAEVVIFFFGPGGGGSVAENLKRWKGMFVPPQGKSIEDVAKVEEIKVGNVPVTYLDVTGTYKFKARPFDANSKEELKPNHRMLGVVFASKNGPYFLRCVGPSNTVTHHKKGFDEFLKGFK